MGDAGFFKGTSADQDSRFSNKQKKLLKSMKFPPEFDEKVDMKKVKLDVMRPWISQRITELLGFEDEVVIDFAYGLLEEENPDPKMMQINLTGFLEKNTQQFILELWRLLLSAQNAVGGVPPVFLEQKKQEILKRKEEARSRDARRNEVMENIRRRKQQEIEDLEQQRPRRSRFDDRPPRYIRSRSPARRRGRSRSISPDRSSRYRGNRSSRYHDYDRSRSRDRDRRSRYRDRSRSRSPSYSPNRRREYSFSRRSRRESRSRSRDRNENLYSPTSPDRRRRSPSTPRRRLSPRPSSASRSRSRSLDKDSMRAEERSMQREEYDEVARLREQALASIKQQREQ
ncbi:hypothetical protein VTP01DRAFT_1499 [Rhizomucor pusillus]|uniref:uncharacterized protein n=1 Tax=Rhizomucor pusillus TaxID=4840 RepID=UPI003744B1E1